LFGFTSEKKPTEILCQPDTFKNESCMSQAEKFCHAKKYEIKQVTDNAGNKKTIIYCIEKKY